jgi:hypothetical protein
MLIAFTIKERGPVSGLGGRKLMAAQRRASKEAWLEVGHMFHNEFRDNRFTPSHARKAGYGLRRGEEKGSGGKMFWGSYTGRKLKKFGHKNPMQWSGDTRKAVKFSTVTPSATTYFAPGAFSPGGSTKGGGVKVAYPGARKLNFRNKNSTLQMADEFRRLIPEEVKALAARYEAVFDAVFNLDNSTTIRQV